MVGRFHHHVFDKEVAGVCDMKNIDFSFIKNHNYKSGLFDLSSLFTKQLLSSCTSLQAQDGRRTRRKDKRRRQRKGRRRRSGKRRRKMSQKVGKIVEENIEKIHND